MRAVWFTPRTADLLSGQPGGTHFKTTSSLWQSWCAECLSDVKDGGGGGGSQPACGVYTELGFGVMPGAGRTSVGGSKNVPYVRNENLSHALEKHLGELMSDVSVVLHSVLPCAVIHSQDQGYGACTDAERGVYDDDDDDDDDGAAPVSAGGGAPARLPRYGEKHVSTPRNEVNQHTGSKRARHLTRRTFPFFGSRAAASFSIRPARPTTMTTTATTTAPARRRISLSTTMPKVKKRRRKRTKTTPTRNRLTCEKCGRCVSARRRTRRGRRNRVWVMGQGITRDWAARGIEATQLEHFSADGRAGGEAGRADGAFRRCHCSVGTGDGGAQRGEAHRWPLCSLSDDSPCNNALDRIIVRKPPFLGRIKPGENEFSKNLLTKLIIASPSEIARLVGIPTVNRRH